jgi:hypothetical protein
MSTFSQHINELAQKIHYETVMPSHRIYKVYFDKINSILLPGPIPRTIDYQPAHRHYTILLYN